MITSVSDPQRLYLMQVATGTVDSFTFPVVCYLVQTTDGQNILIDSGYSRTGTTTETRADAQGPRISITHGQDVIEQLATIGLQPADIDLLICTHYDEDHAGNLAAFPNARLIAQRLQHEIA